MFCGVELVWGFQEVAFLEVVSMGVPLSEAWQLTETHGVDRLGDASCYFRWFP
jgi:hypothetical protein